MEPGRTQALRMPTRPLQDMIDAKVAQALVDGVGRPQLRDVGIWLKSEQPRRHSQAVGNLPALPALCTRDRHL